MLIAPFLLLATIVNGLSEDQHGPRRTKQLDLQDIQTSLNENPTTTLATPFKNDNIVNGYLPPVSSLPVVPNVAGAQSQQTFDFKPVNSVRAEDEPCKPPFNQTSCNFKSSSSSESKIPKPSRDLTPPYNDIDQKPAFPANPRLQQKQEIKITTESRKEFAPTTEKLKIKSFEQVTPQSNLKNFKSQTSSTAKAKVFPNKAEATNELRSYLPPQAEYSAAAQTNVAAVQPANQNNNHDHHHDHHHGHHGENFNICDDAFHSFLCAPLKARKRITGAFPSNLRGQSSFINYQKFLPNFEREPASSNTFQNEYLPPKPVSSSTNLIQSTQLPFTTKRPVVITTTTTTASTPPSQIIPKPSNSNNNFYIPPLPNNRIVPEPSDTPSLIYLALKPTSTPKPTVISTTTVSSTFANPSFDVEQFRFNTGSSAPTVFNSLSSNENRFYLPPNPNPNPQPSASFLSTSRNIRPTITPTVSPKPSASFVSTSRNVRPTITPVISPQPSASFALTSRNVRPTITPTITPQPQAFGSQNPSVINTFGPLSSNTIFISQKPKSQTTLSFSSTTAKPFVKYEEVQKATPAFVTTSPVIQVSTQAPQTPISVSFVPQTLTESSKNFKSSFKYTEQSTNVDKAYLPPDVREPAAAQISSEAVAVPQNKNPFHHGRDLCTDPFHSFLCVNAKPRKRITGQLPSGFSPESSNTKETRLSPEPSNQDENKVRPDNALEKSPAQNLGYVYPKPSNPLPTLSNIIPTSTISPSTGYSYPKPDIIFPFPSEQKLQFTAQTPSTTAKPELRPSEARVVSGYQYPQPDNALPLPAAQSPVTQTTSSPTTGYSYPKPLKPSPTEQNELRQKLKPKLLSSQADLASPTNQVKGYQYPKPEQSLKLPEKTSGYSYPKPINRLELPTENRSKLPQSNPNADPLGPLTSAEFIPVNKLNFKRSESKLLAGLRRFGERQKKRFREA